MADLFGGREPTLIMGFIPGVLGRDWSADQRIDIGIWLCELCGAVVGNQAKHETWHAANPGGES